MGWKDWKGEELVKLLDAAGRAAVQDTGYIILEAAQQQVPLDQGTLLESGAVIMAPEGPACVICFGGGPGTGYPLVDYALKWHENSAKFQRGRKRFYLKDPVNQLGAKTIQAAMKKRTEELFR